MKKLFALLVALALMLSAAAWAEETPSDTPVGTWYLTSLTTDGVTTAAADLGLSVRLELNADGAAVIHNEASGSESGSWGGEGDTMTLTIDGREMTLRHMGDVLTAVVRTTALVFSRDPAAEGAPWPEPIRADAVSDFNGAWRAEAVRAFGLTMTPDGAGTLIGDVFGLGLDGITIDGGLVTVSEGDARMLGFVDGALAGGDERLTLARGDALLWDQGGVSLLLSRVHGPISAPDPEALSGLWSASAVYVDGEAVDFDTQIAAWPVLFGSNDITVQIDGTTVQLFGEQSADYAFEDGRLKLIQPPIPGVPAGMLDRVITLRSDDRIEVSAMGMVVLCDRVHVPSPYEGVWRAAYISTAVIEGDPQDLWHLEITLTIAPDGTACLDYIEPDEGMCWYERDGQTYYGDGARDLAVLTLMEDDTLMYTAVNGDTMIMVRADS